MQEEMLGLCLGKKHRDIFYFCRLHFLTAFAAVATQLRIFVFTKKGRKKH
jgi:hypothetical protein